ncbi:MAG: PG0541 family transporter-associated protein [Syntrophales bacterium]
MKMCMLVYTEAADELVIAAVKEAGINGYTKMVEARGEGTQTEPKLGTHIWPGKNNVLFFTLPDEELPRIRKYIRELESESPHAGVRLFIMPLDESL